MAVPMECAQELFVILALFVPHRQQARRDIDAATTPALRHHVHLATGVLAVGFPRMIVAQTVLPQLATIRRGNQDCHIQSEGRLLTHCNAGGLDAGQFTFGITCLSIDPNVAGVAVPGGAVRLTELGFLSALLMLRRRIGFRLPIGGAPFF
jgi:hypothetical protein